MIISFNTGKINTGGKEVALQQKKVTVTSNGLDVIIPDAGYDGLSTVYVQTKVDGGGSGGGVELSSTEINITENGVQTFVPDNGGWNEVKIHTNVVDENDANFYKNIRQNLYWETEGGVSSTFVPDFNRCLVDGWEHYYFDVDNNEYQAIINNNGEPYICPFLDAITEEKLRNDGVYFYEETDAPVTGYNELSYNKFNGENITIKVLDTTVTPKIINQYGFSEDYVIENPYTNNSYDSVYIPIVKGGYIKFNDNETSVILWHNYKGGDMTVFNNTPNNRINSVVVENGEITIYPRALSYENNIDYLQFLLINGYNIEDAVWVFDNLSNAEIFYKNIRNFKKIDLSKQPKIDYLFQNCKRIELIENVEWGTPTSMGSTFGNCSLLHTIDMTNVDLSNVSDLKYTFSSCYKLKNLKFGKNAKARIGLDLLENLSVESALSVIDGLYDFVGNGETPTSLQGKLDLSTYVLSKLSDEQKAIATSKGWTLA